MAHVGEEEPFFEASLGGRRDVQCSRIGYDHQRTINKYPNIFKEVYFPINISLLLKPMDHKNIFQVLFGLKPQVDYYHLGTIQIYLKFLKKCLSPPKLGITT